MLNATAFRLGTIVDDFEIKTRLQLEAKTADRSIFRTVQGIISNNGITGLWRGTTATVLRNVPGSGLYFWVLSIWREKGSTFASSDVVNITGGVFSRVVLRDFNL